jgi:hypothetical protein
MDIVVACTLAEHDRAVQAERWHKLLAHARLERVEVPDGLHLRFRDDPGVEGELVSLVAVERTCCRWARWEVERQDGALVLRVTSEGPGVSALHGMLAR